jgi:acyl-[acyl-carrier-protein]-phospholipid O-acyltransferase/long-chain-fatty-acid--[acyl-carrier-protein] ligase
MNSQLFQLLRTRRFFPLFLTQFLGAFNDNLFKNALIVLIIYSTKLSTSIDPKILVTIAAGLFILPFVLFSALAGKLSDKFEKSRLAIFIKYIEVVMVIFAYLGFYFSNIWILLVILFLFGLHSTFFSPIKYSLVPDHLKKDEVLAGNALIESATFVAILTGTILGQLLILTDNGVEIVSALLLLFAVIGVVASYFIPKSGPFVPDLKINVNIFSETKNLIKLSMEKNIIFQCIIGISWFWFVGATYFSQFAAFTKDSLNGDQTVVSILLTAFTIGIAFGSILSQKLLKGEISPKYIRFGIIGMTIFSVDLYLASSSITPTEIIGFADFFLSFNHLRVVVDLILIAICGGIYIVPLNALLQINSAENSRSRMIAANNVMNGLFMVVSAIAISIILAFGVSIPMVFLITGILNIFIGFYIYKKLD